MKVDGQPMRRSRRKRTLIDVVKIDMKKCNFFEDLAQNISEWRNRIRVVDPNIAEAKL